MPQKGPEMGEVKPWWLDLILIGFEDDDDDSDDEDSDDEDEDDEDDEDEESDEDEEDSDDEDDDEDEDEDEDKKSKSKKPDVKGLKSALRKERMGHKKFKRLYNQKVAQDKKSKKPDLSKEKPKDEEVEDKGPSDREKRLAGKLMETAIDNVVTRYATKLNFLDPEDAVRLVKRSEIEYDQDEDDPTLIEIDEESVEDAVKELARKKKHLIGSRNGKTTKTGSKFGGKKKKGTSSDDAIRNKFGLSRSPL